MTKPELLALLREADAESCYSAMLSAVWFVCGREVNGEQVMPADSPGVLMLQLIRKAEQYGEPDALMGPALMMVPEGFDWLVRDDTGKPRRAIVWQPRKWSDAIAVDHTIPAIALTICNVEAMP